MRRCGVFTQGKVAVIRDASPFNPHAKMRELGMLWIEGCSCEWNEIATFDRSLVQRVLTFVDAECAVHSKALGNVQ